MGARCTLLRRHEKCGEKSSFRRHHFGHFGQAANNLIGEKVRKNGKREQVVKLLSEQIQLETIVDGEMGIFISQAGELRVRAGRLQ